MVYLLLYDLDFLNLIKQNPILYCQELALNLKYQGYIE